jgi:hypothetical protein
VFTPSPNLRTTKIQKKKKRKRKRKKKKRGALHPVALLTPPSAYTGGICLLFSLSLSLSLSLLISEKKKKKERKKLAGNSFPRAGAWHYAPRGPRAIIKGGDG